MDMFYRRIEEQMYGFNVHGTVYHNNILVYYYLTDFSVLWVE